MNRRHMEMSCSCKHWVHHDLAISTRVISIEDLGCRVSQEPRRGTEGENNIGIIIHCVLLTIHPSIYILETKKAVDVHYKIKSNNYQTLLLIKQFIHNGKKNPTNNTPPKKNPHFFLQDLCQPTVAPHWFLGYKYSTHPGHNMPSKSTRWEPGTTCLAGPLNQMDICWDKKPYS